jgi:hypothetical protein
MELRVGDTVIPNSSLLYLDKNWSEMRLLVTWLGINHFKAVILQTGKMLPSPALKVGYESTGWSYDFWQLDTCNLTYEDCM